MAGGSNLDDEDGITGINVVPLVDIMLVLLIIFMVTTEFVQQEIKNRLPPNVPIELPKAASAQDTNPSLLSVVLNQDGLLFLNGEESTIEKVQDYVNELKAAGKPLEAVIAADQNLSHGRVVEVVDVLRLMGVADVAINTKKQEIE